MDEAINYKERDVRSIITLLRDRSCSMSIKEIIANSGADRLRVYPILFELELSNQIKVVSRSKLGIPEEVIAVKT